MTAQFPDLAGPERGTGVRIVVLAAQRKGVVNPLAERFAVSHKCLIPLQGQPLIRHIMTMLARHFGEAGIAISVEPEVFADIRAILSDLPGAERIELIPAADNLADSVLAAAGAHDGPLIVTTADHALLRPASVSEMIAALKDSEVAVAMARRDAVLAAHPTGQRRFYEFRDHGYSNCNLYGLSGRKALRAVEIFRGGGQFARNAGRIVHAFGLLNLLALRFRLVSLADGLRGISRRMGLTLTSVILADGSQAIDVDNDRTYDVVIDLLNAREITPAAAR